MNPGYTSIGEEFVKAYYTAYDSAENSEVRATQIANFYHDEALFNFEDDKIQGKPNIAEKIKSLPLQKVSHALTKVDCQPTLDGGVLIVVTGQLKADEDKPMGFNHVFQLRQVNTSYFIMHEVFRLALHNF